MGGGLGFQHMNFGGGEHNSTHNRGEAYGVIFLLRLLKEFNSSEETSSELYKAVWRCQLPLDVTRMEKKGALLANFRLTSDPSSAKLVQWNHICSFWNLPEREESPLIWGQDSP